MIAGSLAAYSIARRGLSARAEPSRVEELAARAMRRLATPRAVRTQPNPVKPTEAVLTEPLQGGDDRGHEEHQGEPKPPMKVEEIEAGTRVAVTARMEKDKTLTAKTIEVGTAPAESK